MGRGVSDGTPSSRLYEGISTKAAAKRTGQPTRARDTHTAKIFGSSPRDAPLHTYNNAFHGLPNALEAFTDAIQDSPRSYYDFESIDRQDEKVQS